MLVSIIVFILILSFLVFIHELGHFLAAKFVRVRVEEFGIGYPPLAKRLFKKWGTVFTLNYLPFGGFVKIYGEEYDTNLKNSGAFFNASALKRLLVILAGPLVNIVFGIVAFGIAFSFVGIPTSLINQARIAEVAEDSPAALAGISSGYNLIKLKSAQGIYEINTVDQAISAVNENLGQTVTIFLVGPCEADVCQELISEFEVYLRTKAEIPNPELEGSLGVAFQSEILKHYPWYEMPFRAALVGISQTLQLISATLVELSKMLRRLIFLGQVPQDFMGPVGIVDHAAKLKIFDQGILATLHFSGLISISLAVMNLLPIPALDGGRAIFILLEKIFGKKLIRKLEAKANFGGFVILLSLIILVTFRDLWRIFT